MGEPAIRQLKQLVKRPEPVDGEVVEIDTGYTYTVVLTVETNDNTYYEEYELVDVKEENPSR